MLRSLEFALMLAMYGANDTRTHGSVKGIDFPFTPAQKVISDAPMYCARTLDLDQSFGQQQEKAFGKHAVTKPAGHAVKAPSVKKLHTIQTHKRGAVTA